MSKKAVTTYRLYRLAYVSGEVTLCHACSEDRVVLAATGALGGVSHGSYWGLCDGCEGSEWHVQIKTAPHTSWFTPVGWGGYKSAEDAERARVKADAQWVSRHWTVEQIATDFEFGDCSDRVILPDGSLAYVANDYLSGDPVAYRKRVCRDYGGNVLAVRRADESCVGISHGRQPSIDGYAGRVADVKLTYVGPARDCTGRQVYRVEASS